MDIEVDNIVIRKNKMIWDKITKFLMKEWDKFVLTKEELEIYRAMRLEVRSVEAQLGNKSKEVDKIIEYINCNRKRQPKEIQISHEELNS